MKTQILTIEIHREKVEFARRNIVKANIPTKVKIITGDALKVIPTLKDTFDFTFIDAEKNQYFQCLKEAEDGVEISVK